jgi:hypothetical protein
MSDAQAPVEYHSPSSYGQDAGFLIPVTWAFDGDLKRRAPVLDAVNANRVARMVGWRKCLLCKKPFFSPDVKNVHICGTFHSQYAE